MLGVLYTIFFLFAIYTIITFKWFFFDIYKSNVDKKMQKLYDEQLEREIRIHKEIQQELKDEQKKLFEKKRDKLEEVLYNYKKNKDSKKKDNIVIK